MVKVLNNSVTKFQILPSSRPGKQLSWPQAERWQKYVLFNLLHCLGLEARNKFTPTEVTKTKPVTEAKCISRGVGIPIRP
jgi:hypothetical protein